VTKKWSGTKDRFVCRIENKAYRKKDSQPDDNGGQTASKWVTQFDVGGIIDEEDKREKRKRGLTQNT